jgi:hypothetical protein
VRSSEGAGDDRRVRELVRRVERLEAEAEIARRLAGFSSPGSERLRVYRFIESEAASFAVRSLCKVAGVSASAYYAWRSRGEGPSEKLIDEAVLANRIFDVWHRSRRRYGAPRVTALEINQVPCTAGNGGGCAGLLPSMLPPGAQLNVYGPDGYFQTFYGRQP